MQVTIEQEDEADNAFSTLMGEAVEERRNFHSGERASGRQS